MATLALRHKKKPLTPKKALTAARLKPVLGTKEIAASEFKAKCLALIDEVHRTGREFVITKRGKPFAKLVCAPIAGKKESIIGRFERIGEIVGDPDDLINPVFPLEDYDMLK